MMESTDKTALILDLLTTRSFLFQKASKRKLPIEIIRIVQRDHGLTLTLQDISEAKSDLSVAEIFHKLTGEKIMAKKAAVKKTAKKATVRTTEAPHEVSADAGTPTEATTAATTAPVGEKLSKSAAIRLFLAENPLSNEMTAQEIADAVNAKYGSNLAKPTAHGDVSNVRQNIKKKGGAAPAKKGRKAKTAGGAVVHVAKATSLESLSDLFANFAKAKTELEAALANFKK